jgi:hypothetical protein
VTRGYAEDYPEEVGLEIARRIVSFPTSPQHEEDLMGHILEIPTVDAETAERPQDVVQMELVSIKTSISAGFPRRGS